MLWYALISCLQLRHSLLKFLGPKFPRENATSCNTFLALALIYTPQACRSSLFSSSRSACISTAHILGNLKSGVASSIYSRYIHIYSHHIPAWRLSFICFMLWSSYDQPINPPQRSAAICRACATEARSLHRRRPPRPRHRPHGEPRRLRPDVSLDSLAPQDSGLKSYFSADSCNLYAICMQIMQNYIRIY